LSAPRCSAWEQRLGGTGDAPAGQTNLPLGGAVAGFRIIRCRTSLDRAEGRQGCRGEIRLDSDADGGPRDRSTLVIGDSIADFQANEAGVALKRNEIR